MPVNLCKNKLNVALIVIKILHLLHETNLKFNFTKANILHETKS